MTALRQVIKLSIGKADLAELESIARLRTEPACRVEGARVLLAYRQDPSFYAVGQALGMHHQKVQRYIERAKADGAMAALDRHRPFVPERGGPGHCLQDPRRTRGEAAQGALLLGTPGPRVRGQDGAGAVRLPQGEHPEECCGDGGLM